MSEISKPPKTKSGTAARPDFAQLETFLKVAETRSFAAAARQIGVSQPAVSQTIARLEEFYGADLFERRRGSPVALTPVGRAILPKARLLLFIIDQQIERAIATAQSIEGSLSVGLLPGLAFGPLGSAITEIREKRPDIRLHFVESSPSELLRQLNERVIDIVFASFLPHPASGSNTQERLWNDALVVALRNDHLLASKADIYWADLSSQHFILRSHQGDLSTYRAISTRMGDQPFSCDLHDVSRGTIIEMVRLGMGISILFASAAAPRDGIVFRHIAESNASIWVEAVWPKHDRNPLRHRLLASARSHAAAAFPIA